MAKKLQLLGTFPNQVKTVNGVSPDENGNVEIPISDSGENPGQDGEDGFSPIATVTQTADGATITITDKNGTTTATVTNGKDGKDGADGDRGEQGLQGIPGEKGEKGDKGDKGDTGAAGKDGSDGQPGTNGKDGHTPVRGEDYYTEADKAEIVAAVIEELGGLPVSGYIDGDNNIVLTANNLADGTYSIAYKLADGTYAGTGSLTVGAEVEPEPEPEPDEPEYTNILTSGDYEIQLNKRWSNSSGGYIDCNGMIAFTIPIEDVLDKTIYFKGFPSDTKPNDKAPIWITIDSSNTRVSVLQSTDTTGTIWTAKNLITRENGVYGVVVNTTNFLEGTGVALAINMAINTGTAITAIPADAVMTIDEEIV